LRRLLIALGGWGLITLSCLPAMARTSHDVHGGNCVAYARELTGVHLDGNAAAWWPHAEGRYERGHKPEVGAILVFKPYGRMHVGHVAVVSRVVSAREVLVDQANWVRGRVTKAISVVDASVLNDWTSVKVQYQGTHGRENPTYGFIYPRAMPAEFEQAVADEAQDRQRADHVAARAKHHKDVPDEEVAAYHHAAPRHIAERPTSHTHGGEAQIASTADPAASHVAEHSRHHKDDGEQTAAATNTPPTHQVAEHATHHTDKAAHDQATADAPPASHQLADAEPAPHRHKVILNAKVAYVIY
jgi:surface antigen